MTRAIRPKPLPIETLRIVKDSDLISDDEVRILAQTCRKYLPYALAAWGNPFQMKVEYSTTPKEGVWNFFITEQERQMNAFGWHGSWKLKPAAWISPAACGLNPAFPAGHEGALWGVFAGETTLWAGLASVLTHELVEAIADPDITRWVDFDEKREILVEPGDQANCSHFPLEVVTSLIRQVKKTKKIKTRLGRSKTIVLGTVTEPVPVHKAVVVADATTAAWYNKDTKPGTPLTIASALFPAGPAAKMFTKPLTEVHGTYGTLRDKGDKTMIPTSWSAPDDDYPAK